jgi:hypothetical protein
MRGAHRQTFRAARIAACPESCEGAARYQIRQRSAAGRTIGEFAAQ